jgi:hypothetical protein
MEPRPKISLNAKHRSNMCGNEVQIQNSNPQISSKTTSKNGKLIKVGTKERMEYEKKFKILELQLKLRELYLELKDNGLVDEYENLKKHKKNLLNSINSKIYFSQNSEAPYLVVDYKKECPKMEKDKWYIQHPQNKTQHLVRCVDEKVFQMLDVENQIKSIREQIRSEPLCQSCAIPLNQNIETNCSNIFHHQQILGNSSLIGVMFPKLQLSKKEIENIEEKIKENSNGKFEEFIKNVKDEIGMEVFVFFLRKDEELQEFDKLFQIFNNTVDELSRLQENTMNSLEYVDTMKGINVRDLESMTQLLKEYKNAKKWINQFEDFAKQLKVQRNYLYEILLNKF